MSVIALVGVALGTLVSEDLATVAAGGLVRAGYTTMGSATLACVAGVYLGDQALWVVGRLVGRHALTHRWVRSRITRVDLDRLGEQLERHLGVAIVVSRFVPGSRLPMYLAAGVWGRRPVAFAAWSLLAVLLWTPPLLWASVALGDVAAMALAGGASRVAYQAAAMGVGLLALRTGARALCGPTGGD